MRIELAYIVFLPSLAFIVAGSIGLSRELRHLGAAYRIQPAMMGLIAALGADSPEISSAAAAMLAGNSEVGIGVVLGSNLFNLAALLGLTAAMSGGLGVQRSSLLFNGGVSLLVTGVTAMFLTGLLSPGWFMALLCLIVIPYVLMLWARAPAIRKIPVPSSISNFLAAAAAGEKKAGEKGKEESTDHRTTWNVAASLLAIVAGSTGIVHASLRIADAWGISSAIVGTLILAVLTGFPNTYTAFRLARRGKGTAVVSETLNSNTINIIVGIGVSAVALGLGRIKDFAILEIFWLLGMTAAAILLGVGGSRIKRRGGLIVIGLYLLFVGIRIWV